MARDVLSDADIALLEHEVIKSMCLLEGNAESDIWYVTGVHDMAERIILAIRNNEQEREEEYTKFKFESGVV